MSRSFRVSPWLTAAGALASAMPAAAAETFYLTQSAPAAITVMDPNWITTSDGTPVRGSWTVSVKKTLLDTGPPQPGYIKTIKEYDCQRRRVLWRTFSVYSRYGALVMKKDNADSSWDIGAPQLEDEGELRIVCDGAGGRSVVNAPSLTQLVLTLMAAWDPPAAQPAATGALARKPAP